MKKNSYSFQDVGNETRVLAEKGITGLLPIGIASFEGKLFAKKGFPWIVYGSAGHGKSEVVMELLVNLSILYGFKHCIYLGEGGGYPDIFLEIMHKLLGKKYQHATQAEKIYAEQFVNEHFIIVNLDTDYTIGGFQKVVSEIEKLRGIKFDTTLIDPWNDLVLETELFNGREDHYLAYALKKVRISSKENNRIDIIVNHTADIKAVTDKEGNRYTPPAMPSEVSGGRTFHRRAFVMLLVYRPPAFLKSADGIPYAENETHIYIQKIKPKQVGKVGMVKMFYDWKRNQYYSYTSSGQMLYSCEKIEDLQPKKVEVTNAIK